MLDYSCDYHFYQFDIIIFSIDFYNVYILVEAKLRTLKFFKAHPSAKATDLAGAFSMPVFTAQMEVFRLYEEKREKNEIFRFPRGAQFTSYVINVYIIE